MVILFGAGTPAATTAGWMLLVAHAAFKCALFMVVGVIDHQTGTRDLRELPPLSGGWQRLNVVALLAVASMAGVPLAAGFIAKELAYGALSERRSRTSSPSWPGRSPGPGPPARTRGGSPGARPARPGAGPTTEGSCQRHRRGRSSCPPRSWLWSV